MTDDSAFKKQVRARMTETGENYTTARRAVIAGRDPGQPPVALRVFLAPHVDLELTADAARAYAAADEQGQREMGNRLLAEHIELAGAAESGVATGSRILPVQELRLEEISAAIYRRIGQGPATIGVSDDQDRIRIDISTERPGAVFGHGGAEIDRLRAELEELTGGPVMLNIRDHQGPPANRRETTMGPGPASD